MGDDTGEDTLFEPTELGKTELQRIGRFILTGQLGRGGMGVVHEAIDPNLERTVALKVMTLTDNHARKRLLQEAKSMAQIKHPNVVQIYELVTEGDTCALAMELVEGVTLDDILAGKPIDERQAARFTAKVAYGLQAIHDAGFIHRDIKPGNILIERDPDNPSKDFGALIPKIADFGLVKDPKQNLTLPGMVLGTPVFMSPEQARSDPIDHRSDIFSLGGAFYAMVTGKYMFSGTNIGTTMTNVENGRFLRPRKIKPDLSKDIESIILKMVALHADDRYQSARAVAHDLLTFAQGEEVDVRAPLIAQPQQEKVQLVHALLQQYKLPLSIIFGVAFAGGVLSALVGPNDKPDQKPEITKPNKDSNKPESKKTSKQSTASKKQPTSASQGGKPNLELLLFKADNFVTKADELWNRFKEGPQDKLEKVAEFYEQAIDLYKQRLKHGNNADVLQNFAIARFDLARVLSQMDPSKEQEHYQGLDTLVEKVIKATPTANMYDTLSQILKKLGQNKKALEALTKATELNPTEGAYHFDKGLLEEELGETEEAKKSFRKACDHSKDREYFSTCARIHFDDGDYKKVLEIAELGLKKTKNNPEMKLYQAKSYAELEQFTKALSYLEPIASQNVRDFDANFYVAFCYLGLGTPRKGFDAANNLMSYHQDRWDTYAMNGFLLERAGKHEAAQSMYETAYKIDSEAKNEIEQLRKALGLDKK